MSINKMLGYLLILIGFIGIINSPICYAQIGEIKKTDLSKTEESWANALETKAVFTYKLDICEGEEFDVKVWVEHYKQGKLEGKWSIFYLRNYCLNNTDSKLSFGVVDSSLKRGNKGEEWLISIGKAAAYKCCDFNSFNWKSAIKEEIIKSGSPIILAVSKREGLNFENMNELIKGDSIYLLKLKIEQN